MTPSICEDYFKSVKVKTIKGTSHCKSITIANDVVIRTEESKPNLLLHIDVIKCADAYKAYGDIGANGIIVEETNQTFEFIVPSQVDFRNQSSYLDKKKIYFLNGFLIANDSLRISKKAIIRTDVLPSKKYENTFHNDNSVLINIWTLTKKEVRKSLRKCHRLYE
jgi:hypothetical protein